MTCGSAALKGSDETRVSQLGSSIAGGLIVTVTIYAVGHISGAYMNPAVTIGFTSVGHLPWKQVPFYAAAQFTRAISSAFTLCVLLHPIKCLGTTSPSGTHLQSLVMKFVVTFSMMFIASAVTIDIKSRFEFRGATVGFAVCITSILAAPVSGGSMSPARTLGPAIASNYYNGLWLYFAGPVMGTLLGAWSYRFIRVKGKPVQAISTRSFSSSQLRQVRNHDQDVTADEVLVTF